jgi:hypothetical protein
MKGTLVAASAAATATGSLDTGEGRQFIDRFANEVFDDAFGINNPRVAHDFASFFAHTAATLTFEWAFANLVAKPAVGKRPYDPKKDNLSEFKGLDPYDAGTVPPEGFTPEQIDVFVDKTDKAIAATGHRPLKRVKWLTHIGSSGKMPSPAALKVGNPSDMGALYGITGVCHQVSNMSLLQSGLTNTVLATSWDTYLSTFAYGTYGGGLPYKFGQSIWGDYRYVQENRDR